MTLHRWLLRSATRSSSPRQLLCTISKLFTSSACSTCPSAPWPTITSLPLDQPWPKWTHSTSAVLVPVISLRRDMTLCGSKQGTPLRLLLRSSISLITIGGSTPSVSPLHFPFWTTSPILAQSFTQSLLQSLPGQLQSLSLSGTLLMLSDFGKCLEAFLISGPSNKRFEWFNYLTFDFFVIIEIWMIYLQ